MEKFKRIFKLQLKLLPLIGLGLIITGIILYEVKNNSYTELSKQEFTKIALENNITDFTQTGGRFKLETKLGDKYYHKFNSYSEQEEFCDLILNNFKSITHRNTLSFYRTGIYAIIIIVIGILLLNIVIVLWFVAFYNLLKSEFNENHNKWIWFISFIILPLITPLFYMLISDSQKKK